MTSTKIAVGTVSYGIGVKNRYAAFLEEEADIFNSTPSRVVESKQNAAPTKSRAANHEHNEIKQKTATHKSRSSLPKSSQRSNISTSNISNSNSNNNNNNNNNKHEQTKDGHGESYQKRFDSTQAKRADKHGKTALNCNAIPQKPVSGKHANLNQENNMNGTRFPRNHSNNHNNNHSNTASSSSRENDGENKFSKIKGQRFNNNRSRDEDKKLNTDQQQDRQITGYVSNDEEKRQRQYKRADDLKHKDYVKRERVQQRQQFASDNQQQNGVTTNNESNTAQSENNISQLNRGQPRFKRDGLNNRGSDEFSRNFNKQGERVQRDRRMKRQDGEQNGVGEQEDRREARTGSDSQRPQLGDRPRRIRNGFEPGPKSNRGPRSEYKNHEDQRPIPNFSDKSDFPSLAS